jgi:hypothetical protein
MNFTKIPVLLACSAGPLQVSEPPRLSRPFFLIRERPWQPPGNYEFGEKTEQVARQTVGAAVRPGILRLLSCRFRSKLHSNAQNGTWA